MNRVFEFDLAVCERLCCELFSSLLWIGMPIFKTAVFVLNFDF